LAGTGCEAWQQLNSSAAAPMAIPDPAVLAALAAQCRSWRSICWSPQCSQFAAVSNSGAGNRVMVSP